MTEKTGYKYSIKFSQSLTSGTIGFEGYYAFDNPDEYRAEKLVTMLKDTEDAFKGKDYKIASIEPTNATAQKIKQEEQAAKEEIRRKFNENKAKARERRVLNEDRIKMRPMS